MAIASMTSTKIAELLNQIEIDDQRKREQLAMAFAIRLFPNSKKNRIAFIYMACR